MSTATYDRPPLYAVRTPPEQKAEFGLLLALRRRARQALDTLLALPRGAAGWVLRHLRVVLDAGQHRLLDRASALLSSGARLLRGVGVVPVMAAVLSTPPAWPSVVRWARAAGSRLASVAARAWARTKSLLTRSTTGARVATGLSRAGATVVQTVRSVAAHPAVQRIMHAAFSLAGAIRPVSQGVVVHRLLALLVPVLWVRVAVEAVAMTFVLAPDAAEAATNTGNGSGAAPVPDVQRDSVMPMPTAAPAPSGENPAEEPVVVEPQNRAERRAQQQEQAQARRSHTRR